MALLDRLAAGSPVRQPAFEQYVAALDADTRKALMKAAYSSAWSDKDLVRILQDEGIVISEQAFSAWRQVARAMVIAAQNNPTADPSAVPTPVLAPTPIV